MNGPQEIRNINTHRALTALEGLRNAAVLAKQQNHPKADEHQARYEVLAKELGVQH